MTGAHSRRPRTTHRLRQHHIQHGGPHSLDVRGCDTLGPQQEPSQSFIVRAQSGRGDTGFGRRRAAVRATVSGDRAKSRSARNEGA